MFMHSLFILLFAVLTGIPTVEVASGTVDILYGHNHTILCKIVSVYDLTTVYWQKMFNGTIENITSDNHGIAGATIPRPSLTILKANPADSGQYACCAVNIAGTGQSNFINVTVFGGKLICIGLLQHLPWSVFILGLK